MPATNAFFSEGVRFQRAETPRSLTSPAYASLMTGLYPHHHGVRKLAARLNEQNVTLAEMLREKGYYTAGFISSFVMVGRLSGMGQGFDLYNDTLQAVRKSSFQRVAEDTVNEVLKWLQIRPKDKPFFLFLHFIDPHGPYSPPDKFVIPFHSSREQILTQDQIPPSQFVPGLLNLFGYVDRYDGEILYLDTQLARLYSAFDGLQENTWFLFVADHGESLGEHGVYLEHGANCYESQTHIPMALLPPKDLRTRYKSGSRLNPVSLVDIAPTAVELAGLSLTRHFDGESLLPALEGKALKSDIRFVERVKSRVSEFAAVNSTHKLIAVQADQDTFELYDLNTDPLEQHNLFDGTAVPSGMMESLLSYANDVTHYQLPFATQDFERIRRSGEAKKKYMEENVDTQQLSDEDREKLRALGYVE